MGKEEWRKEIETTKNKHKNRNLEQRTTRIQRSNNSTILDNTNNNNDNTNTKHIQPNRNSNNNKHTNNSNSNTNDTKLQQTQKRNKKQRGEKMKTKWQTYLIILTSPLIGLLTAIEGIDNNRKIIMIAIIFAITGVSMAIIDNLDTGREKA